LVERGDPRGQLEIEDAREPVVFTVAGEVCEHAIIELGPEPCERHPAPVAKVVEQAVMVRFGAGDPGVNRREQALARALAFVMARIDLGVGDHQPEPSCDSVDCCGNAELVAGHAEQQRAEIAWIV
jgi:hypothetical protein